MKILHLITDLETGGAEMMLLKLVQGMNKSEFQNVAVSMMDGGTLGLEFEKAGVPVYCLGMKRGGISPVYVLRLLRIIRQEKPDIIQTWLYHADLLGMLVALIKRIPFIWNIRCSDLKREDHSRFLFFIIHLLAKSSFLPEAIIANSKAGMLWHEGMGYKTGKFKIIPNGFDTDFFCPVVNARTTLIKELNCPKTTEFVGLIARYNPMKDHRTFLRAAAIINEFKPDVHFILAGRDVDYHNQYLVNTVNELGLNRVVHLLGERNDVNLINAALTVAVSSSYSEGFPNTVGEAMACAVPCVVTDAGDSAYLVGSTGYIVPPSNPDALAQAVMKVLGMGIGEREAMGLSACQRITEYFSLETITEQYQTLYRNVLK